MSLEIRLNKPIREQFADTMLRVGKLDEDLLVMVGDISHGVLSPFREEFPDRYFNVGILESAIISMAAGLSSLGFKPVAHTIAPFLLERAFEQIKLDFCYQGLPGNLVTVGSAFDYSNLGSTHHCYGDFAMLKTLQNTEILFPGTAQEFDILFGQAYSNDQLTVYRLPGTSHGVQIDPTQINIGEPIKIREGSDITLIATGPQLASIVGATDNLIDQGWDPEVIYVHSIRPLDHQMIRDSVGKTGKFISAEEHMESGGLGDDILRMTRDMMNVRSAAIAIPDTFVLDYGTYEQHCETLGMTPEGVVQKIVDTFGNP
jgi:transketolase